MKAAPFSGFSESGAFFFPSRDKRSCHCVSYIHTNGKEGPENWKKNCVSTPACWSGWA